MLISIAIPCYRSEKNLEQVVEEIKVEFAKREGYDYQIILVCDGSPDHTDDVIRKLCLKDAKIIGVILSRNYTQRNARMAALRYVDGDVLVYMDDDGQHDAKDIFRLADKITEGYDVVYVKFDEKSTSKFRILTSDFFSVIAARLNKWPKGIKASAYFACSRFAVDQLQRHNNPIPSPNEYLYSITSKVTNIKSTQRERISGKSGYSFFKLIRLAIVSLTNYTVAPLRIMDTIGFFIAGIGFLYGLVLVFRKILFGINVAGYTSGIVIMLILGGIIIVGLGLVGEYVGHIYMLLSNKPQYVVREEINVNSINKDNESFQKNTYTRN